MFDYNLSSLRALCRSVTDVTAEQQLSQKPSTKLLNNELCNYDDACKVLFATFAFMLSQANL